jgi:hypothetical protein
MVGTGLAVIAFRIDDPLAVWLAEFFVFANAFNHR